MIHSTSQHCFSTVFNCFSAAGVNAAEEIKNKRSFRWIFSRSEAGKLRERTWGTSSVWSRDLAAPPLASHSSTNTPHPPPQPPPHHTVCIKSAHQKTTSVTNKPVRRSSSGHQEKKLHQGKKQKWGWLCGDWWRDAGVLILERFFKYLSFFHTFSKLIFFKGICKKFSFVPILQSEKKWIKIWRSRAKFKDLQQFLWILSDKVLLIRKNDLRHVDVCCFNI